MAREFAGYLIQERAFDDAVSSIWHGHSARNPSRRVTLRLFSLPEDGGLAGAMYACREDAEAAMRLEHERIVPTDDIARRNGRTFAVSPYTPALPLSHYLQGGVPGPDRALALLAPLARALDAAARGGLMHGAVHPRTIWIASDHNSAGAPRALLSGFGLHHLLRVLAVQRRDAEVVDDFLYVAPELLRGGRPSNRSDQYALAAAFQHTMSGRPPFEGEHLAALFGAHLFGRPPVAGLDDDAQALESIVARALSKNPDHRFERCGDFVDAVAEWQRQRAVPAAVPAPAAASGAAPAAASGAAPAAASGAAPRPRAPVRASAPVGAPSPATPRPPRSRPAPRRPRPPMAVRWHPRVLLRARRNVVFASAGAAGVIAVLAVAGLLARGTSSPEPDERVAAQVPIATPAPSEPAGVRWRQQLGTPVTDLHVTAAGLVATSPTRIAVLDPTTGEIRAEFDGRRERVAVSGAGGVFTADGRGLTAHNIADGSVEWRAEIAGVGPPTVSGETVYGISDEGVPQLIATDADTGQQLWQFPSDGEELAFPARTAIAPTDGFVYLADSEAVYGILPTGASLGTTSPVIDADEPAPEPLCVWRTEVEDDLWLSTLHAVNDGVVVADRSGRVCLHDVTDGKPVWCAPVPGVADDEPSVFSADGLVFVVTRSKVTAVDAGTGERAWTHAGRWRDAVLDGRGRLVVLNETGRVSVLSADGEARTLPGITVAPEAVLAIDGDVLYAAEDGGGVVSADLTPAGG